MLVLIFTFWYLSKHNAIHTYGLNNKINNNVLFLVKHLNRVILLPVHIKLGLMKQLFIELD